MHVARDGIESIKIHFTLLLRIAWKDRFHSLPRTRRIKIILRGQQLRHLFFHTLTTYIAHWMRQIGQISQTQIKWGKHENMPLKDLLINEHSPYSEWHFKHGPIRNKFKHSKQSFLRSLMRAEENGAGKSENRISDGSALRIIWPRSVINFSSIFSSPWHIFNLAWPGIVKG